MGYDTMLLDCYQAAEDETQEAAKGIEDAQIQAHDLILKRLQSAQPAAWYKNQLIGKVFTSCDNLLIDALAESCKEVSNALAELLTSPHAKKLHEALASYHGDTYHQDFV